MLCNRRWRFLHFLSGDMAELTHIFDHLPALQSLSADPNLLQGKFVSYFQPRVRFSFAKISLRVAEKSREVKGRLGENFGNAERDEREWFRLSWNVPVVGGVFRVFQSGRRFRRQPRRRCPRSDLQLRMGRWSYASVERFSRYFECFSRKFNDLWSVTLTS